MGCVITITDEPAMRVSERDLLALVPRGKAPAGTGDTAVAHTEGQSSSSAVKHTLDPVPLSVPRWLLHQSQVALGRAWLLPQCEMHFSKSSFTVRKRQIRCRISLREPCSRLSYLTHCNKLFAFILPNVLQNCVTAHGCEPSVERNPVIPCIISS